MTKIDPRTARTCELYRNAMKRGDEPAVVIKRLAELYGVQRPAIRRRLRTGGVLPSYKMGNSYGRRAAGLSAANKAEDRVIPTRPPVYRDPCPRCGTRGDLECGHSRARLGLVLSC